jgi:hypothetical protein
VRVAFDDVAVLVVSHSAPVDARNTYGGHAGSILAHWATVPIATVAASVQAGPGSYGSWSSRPPPLTSRPGMRRPACGGCRWDGTRDIRRAGVAKVLASEIRHILSGHPGRYPSRRRTPVAARRTTSRRGGPGGPPIEPA